MHPFPGHRSRPKAFALLLVLLLLALIAISLTAATRLSLQRYSAAQQAERALQRRWAITSAQHALLPQSEKLLTAAESQSHHPSPILRATIPLPHFTLDLILSDEQAKLNLNAVANAHGLPQTQRTLTQLIRQLNSPTPIHLAPNPLWSPHPPPPSQAAEEKGTLTFSPPEEKGTLTFSPPAAEPRPPAPPFQTWAQLLPDADPQTLLALTQSLTLWGDGSLNLLRTTPDIAALRFAPTLTLLDAQKLIAQSQSPPNPNTTPDPDTSAPPTLPESIEDQTTDTSTCHALWIILRTDTRPWYHLAIQDDTTDQRPTTFQMQW